MPKKTQHPPSSHRFHLTGDFHEDWERFKQVADWDEEIRQLADDVILKSGTISLAIRFTIKQYLYGDPKKNIPGKYQQFIKQKLEKTDSQIEKLGGDSNNG